MKFITPILFAVLAILAVFVQAEPDADPIKGFGHGGFGGGFKRGGFGGGSKRGGFGGGFKRGGFKRGGFGGGFKKFG